MDQGITVYFTDKPSKTYSTTNYICQGGFLLIIESQGNKFVTTCIPSSQIAEVVVTQLS